VVVVVCVCDPRVVVVEVVDETRGRAPLLLLPCSMLASQRSRARLDGVAQ
jgi:hypothetical protein